MCVHVSVYVYICVRQIQRRKEVQNERVRGLCALAEAAALMELSDREHMLQDLSCKKAGIIIGLVRWRIREGSFGRRFIYDYA